MRELAIAYGDSRKSKFWSNKTTTFEALCERLKTPIRTTESAEEYARMPKAERDEIKDKGGFVAGHLAKNRRLRENVTTRSMLVFDMDDASKEFLEGINAHVPYGGCYYSTHSHTPERPRIRIVLPCTRDMQVDEFNAVARYVAAGIGIDMIDTCSYVPHQLMYWPTVSSNGQYLFGILKGGRLDPDVILAAHPDWRDCSLLPTSPKESVVRERTGKKLQDPLTKRGIVGAFCNAYSVSGAIDKFLRDVYKPSETLGRYDYIKGKTTGGLVIYDDKFAYSHHATDPASGKELNAFDLVRIHMFPGDDEKESFSRMTDFASGDELVRAELRRLKEEEARTEFADWKDGLAYDSRGRLRNNLQNIILIMKEDEYLKHICYNQMADNIEIKGEVPWKHPAKFWRDADDAQLICYVDAKYGTFSQRNYQIGVTKATDDRAYHPIRDFFKRLPDWDGHPRVDTLLIDYLGAEDNEYTRMVTRKTVCAAVARVMRPGIKFDYLLVLNGPQGIGKSTLISRLGREWYSDSLSLTDMADKTAAEKLQGYWIIEIGELAGMKKADIDKVKAFISRQDDKYRASFGRRVTPHPRQCVIIGTTNTQTGYLRDVTGNRRFWSVKTPGTGMLKPWQLTDEDVLQIWAEARVLQEKGEKLYLDQDLEDFSRAEQADAMEQDDREGLVEAYLDMLLPVNWDEMDVYARRDYISYPNDSVRVKGTVRRESVSNIEIWCECFGKSREDIRPSDSYAIAAIMLRIKGWEKTNDRASIKNYGLQRLYKRVIPEVVKKLSRKLSIGCQEAGILPDKVITVRSDQDLKGTKNREFMTRQLNNHYSTK